MARFDELVDRLHLERLAHVDARDWRGQWVNRWVAYADILAFADRCMRSDEVALNNIVRFHRIVDRCRMHYGDLRFYQFTDACFMVGDSCIEVINCAATLHHLCLAMNALQFRRRHPLAHFMVVPRVTIARGQVLQVDASGGTADQYIGLFDAENLLAGSAIVSAYRLERQAVGHDLAAGAEMLTAARRAGVRGQGDAPHRALKAWMARGGPPPGDAVASGSPVVRFPWLLLRPLQPHNARSKTEFWADERMSVVQKTRTLAGVLQRSFGEFMMGKIDPTVMKHYAGAMRELAYYIQMLKGHGRAQAWDPARITEEL